MIPTGPNPTTQARALSMENAEHHDALARTLGHEPTPADYYLAHQQGHRRRGRASIAAEPASLQNMVSTVEGREKGVGWAKQAIWGNMTPSMKAQFPGGVETVSSGDFAAMWAQRFYDQPIKAVARFPAMARRSPVPSRSRWADSRAFRPRRISRKPTRATSSSGSPTIRICSIIRSR